jgi:hypothetical protein
MSNVSALDSSRTAAETGSNKVPKLTTDTVATRQTLELVSVEGGRLIANCMGANDLRSLLLLSKSVTNAYCSIILNDIVKPIADLYESEYLRAMHFAGKIRLHKELHLRGGAWDANHFGNVRYPVVSFIRCIYSREALRHFLVSFNNSAGALRVVYRTMADESDAEEDSEADDADFVFPYGWYDGNKPSAVCRIHDADRVGVFLQASRNFIMRFLRGHSEHTTWETVRTLVTDTYDENLPFLDIWDAFPAHCDAVYEASRIEYNRRLPQNEIGEFVRLG